jgi:hypothetical protein
MNTKKLFFFAIAGLGLAACSNDEVVEMNENNAISFRTIVSGTTRAADIDAGDGTNGLQTLGFTVFANVGSSETNYFPETAFTYSDGAYTSATKYYWPSAGNLDFFAYQYSQSTNNTVTHTARTKTFTVTPSSTAANQTDLVVAFTEGKNKATNSAGVAINFRHAESKVTIKLKNSSTTTTITVGDVVLGNVYTTGTYTFTGSTDNAATPTTTTNTDGNNNNNYLKYSDWSGQGTIGTYTQAAATTSYTSSTTATALTNSMILIPQTLTNATTYASGDAGAVFGGAYITVALKIQNTTNSAYIVGGAESSVTAMWPLPATKWLPGYHYTYTVDLAGGGYFPTNQTGTDSALDPILGGAEIKFVTVTVDAWTDASAISVPE